MGRDRCSIRFVVSGSFDVNILVWKTVESNEGAELAEQKTVRPLYGHPYCSNMGTLVTHCPTTESQ